MAGDEAMLRPPTAGGDHAHPPEPSDPFPTQTAATSYQNPKPGTAQALMHQQTAATSHHCLANPPAHNPALTLPPPAHSPIDFREHPPTSQTLAPTISAQSLECISPPVAASMQTPSAHCPIAQTPSAAPCPIAQIPSAHFPIAQTPSALVPQPCSIAQNPSSAPCPIAQSPSAADPSANPFHRPCPSAMPKPSRRCLYANPHRPQPCKNPYHPKPPRPCSSLLSAPDSWSRASLPSCRCSLPSGASYLSSGS
ncbi:hypothetical protein LIER_10622 [Lithospermum erythrorhizon]|uniref:Uncharacterized protein n=1 Tax=Lithospermum erythrorhizon TaxID=34254 RepID=A0AAV3PL97_LITER